MNSDGDSLSWVKHFGNTVFYVGLVAVSGNYVFFSPIYHNGANIRISLVKLKRIDGELVFAYSYVNDANQNEVNVDGGNYR